MSEELLKTFVEVQLTDEENFLKICETLTRIGIASKTEKKLYQSCNLLHKKGKYYLVSFKEMLALDGNKTNFSDEDRARRNKIAALLEQWKLLKVLDASAIENQCDISKIKIIPFAEKKDWELCPKYVIGQK